MRDFRDLLWYGTEASAQAAAELEAMIASKLQAGPFGGEVNPDYLLSKVGKVGVVSIKGPLLNTDSPIAAFFGISTYPGIRQAMISAVKDGEIDHIVLDVDSGGGSVSGVVDTADLIARVNKVKPVTTFADGTMASAAYWLGSSAGKVFAGKTAITGSIGVIQRHVDLSEQLKQDGVKVEILRAGKFKALANPFEPLTEAAREQIQSQLDAAYQIFVQHVADARGVDYAQADRKMAQGREFFGEQGVDAGLLDGISTFDAVLSKASGPKGVDNASAKYDNGMNQGAKTNMGKQVLTEKDLAALASGANLGATADEQTVAAAKAEAEAKVKADAEAKVKADAEAAKVKADADAATAAAAAAAGDKTNEVVTYLQGQVKEKDAKILEQALELKTAKDKLAAIEANHTSCVEVVRTSVGRLRVALGGSAGDTAALSDVEALAEHKRLSEDFSKKFKVGGVAAVSTEDKEQGKSAAAPLHASLVAATRING